MAAILDLQAFRDVSTRLEPVRRMLADLALAVDLTVAADQARAEISQVIGGLNKTLEMLRQEYQKLRDDIDQSRAEHEEELDRQVQEVCEVVERRKVAVAAAQGDCSVRLAEIETQRRYAEAEHAQAMRRMDLERQQAEQSLATIKQALEDLQARVKGI